MSLKTLKADLPLIIDLEPRWMNHLKYNPIKKIINEGKTYHILNLLEDVCGLNRKNPLINDIKYFHYKEPYVQAVIRDVEVSTDKISKIKKNNYSGYIDIIALLAKLNYFNIHSKKYVDPFIREIIKNNFLDNILISKDISMLVFFLIKMGYSNIYIEKILKRLEEFQNKDGGWDSNLSLSNKSSDIFSTLIVFRTFLSNNLWINKKFLLKAENFLIANHLSKSNNNEDIDRWGRLYSGYKINNLFEGGTLLLLDSLLTLKSDSGSLKVKSIINWLKGLQLESGYFPYNSKLAKQKNIPSTIKILHLIKKYSINL